MAAFDDTSDKRLSGILGDILFGLVTRSTYSLDMRYDVVIVDRRFNFEVRLDYFHVSFLKMEPSPGIDPGSPIYRTGASTAMLTRQNIRSRRDSDSPDSPARATSLY